MLLKAKRKNYRLTVPIRPNKTYHLHQLAQRSSHHQIQSVRFSTSTNPPDSISSSTSHDKQSQSTSTTTQFNRPKSMPLRSELYSKSSHPTKNMTYTQYKNKHKSTITSPSSSSPSSLPPPSSTSLLSPTLSSPLQPPTSTLHQHIFQFQNHRMNQLYLRPPSSLTPNEFLSLLKITPPIHFSKHLDYFSDQINTLFLNDQTTPLLTVTLAQNLDMMKELYSRGANIHLAGIDGNSPLHVAIKNGNATIVKWLLARGADIHQVNPISHYTPLMTAAKTLHTHLLDILVEHNAFVNQQNLYGQTALMIASQYSTQSMVQALIQNGADIQLYDNDGFNVVDYAQRHNKLDMASFIQQQLLSIKRHHQPQSIPNLYHQQLYGTSHLSLPNQQYQSHYHQEQQEQQQQSGLSQFKTNLIYDSIYDSNGQFSHDFIRLVSKGLESHHIYQQTGVYPDSIDIVITNHRDTSRHFTSESIESSSSSFQMESETKSYIIDASGMISENIHHHQVNNSQLHQQHQQQQQQQHSSNDPFAPPQSIDPFAQQVTPQQHFNFLSSQSQPQQQQEQQPHHNEHSTRSNRQYSRVSNDKYVSTTITVQQPYQLLQNYKSRNKANNIFDFNLYPTNPPQQSNRHHDLTQHSQQQSQQHNYKLQHLYSHNITPNVNTNEINKINTHHHINNDSNMNNIYSIDQSLELQMNSLALSLHETDDDQSKFTVDSNDLLSKIKSQARSKKNAFKKNKMKNDQLDHNSNNVNQHFTKNNSTTTTTTTRNNDENVKNNQIQSSKNKKEPPPRRLYLHTEFSKAPPRQAAPQNYMPGNYTKQFYEKNRSLNLSTTGTHRLPQNLQPGPKPNTTKTQQISQNDNQVQTPPIENSIMDNK